MQFKHAATLALGLAAVILAASPASAFIALGGFDEIEVLRYRDWRLVDFDTNQDGQVTAGEGLEYLIYTGPGGFTPEEVQEIQRAAQIWADVPTSYAALRNTGLIRDPLEATSEADLINFVTTLAGLTDDTDIPDFDGDLILLSQTVVTFSVDETVFPDIGTESLEIGVPVTAGTVLDADIIINAEAIRSRFGFARFITIEQLMVREFGLMLGLGPTPTNNVAEPTGNDLFLVEQPVFASRDVNNQRVLIGATPTMFIDAAFINDNGQFRLAQADLAPDDISGITFLYPRGDLSQFFSLEQRARTQTRPGLPSLPLPGALVTAWLDQDADPLTPRIPLYATITGLYESATFNPLTVGDFDMYNMLKRIETPAGEGLQDATYTFTINPLNGLSYTRQQPFGYVLANFGGDTDNEALDGEFLVSGSGAATLGDFISVAFPSEVFNEFGNVFDVSNFDVGTPLRWDESKRTLVSVDTGRTIEDILERRFPMFGDPNDVCPLTVVVGGGTGTNGTGTDGTGTGNDGGTNGNALLIGGLLGSRDNSGGGPGALVASLRNFRDEVLLKSRVGTALVDLYYSSSPALAQWTQRTSFNYMAMQTIVRGIAFLAQPFAALGIVFALALAAVGLRPGIRRRLAKAMASFAFLLLLVGTLALPASALVLPASTGELVAQSDAIVTGTITGVTSRWSDTNRGQRIITDITLTIDNAVKGALSKQTTITFQQLGGRVGDVRTQASELPLFNEGERVLLYLAESDAFGFRVVGARQGKINIGQDKSTGIAYVYANSTNSEFNLQKIAADLGRPKQAGDERPTAILLDDYLQYVRELATAQAAAEAEDGTPAEEAAPEN